MQRTNRSFHISLDIAHAVPLTLVAGLGHAALGTVDLSLLGALLVGSLSAVTDRIPITGKYCAVPFVVRQFTTNGVNWIRPT